MKTNSHPPQDIPPWENEVLDLFVGMFETFGLPRSIALIYGTLYCAETPMQQEDISKRLNISTGSASQGLKLLQSLGAVHRNIPAGQRQSFYTPELSIRRILANFIQTQFRPKLDNGQLRLKSIIDKLPPENHLALQRLETLQAWQSKAKTTLPLLSALFGPGK